MLNLKIIIGSTRPGRAADQVIPWMVSASPQHGGFSVDVSTCATGSCPCSVRLSRLSAIPGTHPSACPQ